MIACLLCMQKKLNYIILGSKKGLELNCSQIIAKHFWLKPSTEKNSKDRICLVCWRTVREFHQFYLSVAEAHNYLEFNDPSSTTATDDYLKAIILDSDTDPLPSISVKSDQPLEDQSVAAELKLEKNDLKVDPDNKVSKTEVCASDRAMRATRRSRLLIENSESNKREMCGFQGEDAEVEVPLSLFLKNASESPRKKRGRPIKTVEDKTELVEIRPAKTEDFPDYDFATNEDELQNNTPLLTENTTSDSDSWCDTEPPERFAEIDPRIAEKPRKKRIRIRPAVPYRRMTKEEIEMKRLQQEKYDEIIARFFDNFPCPKCNLLVCTFGEMRKHFNTEHNGNAPSVICCGRRFPMRKNLADHVLVHLNPEHFKCSECEQFFKDSSTLKRHENTHKKIPEENRNFNCHICSRKLSSKGSLKEHLATIHVPKSEYKFVCKECPQKKFPTKSILRKHMYSSHRPGGVAMCEKCGKSMQSKAALRYHIQSEHSSEPRPKPARVECPICKTSLCDEYSLKLHVTYVHDDRGEEYRCHICGFLSTNARALKRHIAYNHEAQRKFQCTVCDKAFKKSSCLKEHIATHTGSGLYTCPECLMTFACKANFHKHKQRRHGHKPVKRNLIGLVEKKRKKLIAAKEEEAQLLLFNSAEENNKQNNVTS